MKIFKRFIVPGIVIILSLAPSGRVFSQTYSVDGSISVGSGGYSFQSASDFKLNLSRLFVIGSQLQQVDWGIKGVVNSGGYIRVTLAVDTPNGSKVLTQIEYDGTEYQSGYVYNKKPLIGIYESPQVGGTTLTSQYEYSLLRRQRGNLANYVTVPYDSRPVNSKVLWFSNDVKKPVMDIFRAIHNNQIQNPSNIVPVTFSVEISNATFSEFHLPGLGYLVPQVLEGNTRGVHVSVESSDGSLEHYVFSDKQKSASGGQIVFDDTDAIVSTTSGDKVLYEVFGMQTMENPEIKGVPKIWASGFAAQREFITTPDYGPNQYEPWIAFEAQTHFRMINSYPDGFEDNVATEDWAEAGSTVRRWNWYAQRRTDPHSTKYVPEVYYPKTRLFGTKYQRESQSLGWAKQILELYEDYSAGTLMDKYITGFDVDEYLYVGSKKPNASNVASWISQALQEDDPYTNPDILSVHLYPFLGQTTTYNENWQQMWESEEWQTYQQTNADPSDLAVYENYTYTGTAANGKRYPLVWDDRGFPKFGFLMNDMVTEYVRYKSSNDGNSATDLSFDYYFNGYEIQDFESHRLITGSTESPIVSVNGIPQPCAEDCWYYGNKGKNNVKHPGVISITVDPVSNPLRIEFRQEVLNPLDNSSNNLKGFYSSLKSQEINKDGSLTPSQWAMGFGNDNVYTLKGVLPEFKDRISLVMLSYNPGDGIMRPEKTKKLSNGTAMYSPSNNELTATFEVYSGWMAIAAYLKTVDGQDSVIVAGRVPMVMDPPNSLTVPGSNSLPYSNSSLVPAGGADYKEGQGDRAFETMNEIRVNEDPGRGYTNKLGEGYTKYVRDYTLDVGEKVQFSTIGAGRKIQSFWSGGSEDPYQSWRNLSKRMPSDSAGKRLHWQVFKVNSNGLADETPYYDQSFPSRHFTYQFNEEGQFIVQVNLMNDIENPTKVLISVEDFTAQSLSPQHLAEDHKRGSVIVRSLSLEEKRWLSNTTGSDNSTPITQGINLEDYLVAEVKGIASFYAYNLGPRASSAPHREGLRRDFNDRFKWFDEHGGTVEQADLVEDSNANSYLSNFNPTSLWPAAWDKIWLYHNPNKTGTITPKTGNNVQRDGSGDGNNLAYFNSTMDEAFSKLAGAQSTLPWMRWFPWIAISPTNGIKFNRYIKTALELNTFLSNEGGGLFSGEAVTEVGNVSNAIESMEWFDYGSPKSQLVSLEEFDRHLSDDAKNQLEFYYDLVMGRKLIYLPNEVIGNKLIAKNENPTVSTDYPAISNSDDLNKPLYIYIDEANKQVNEDPLSEVPGIPLMTFDGARRTKNQFNAPYSIATVGLDAYSSIIHEGFGRYLKVDLEGFDTGDEVEVIMEVPQNLSNSATNTANNPNSDLYGVGFDLAVNQGQDLVFFVKAYEGNTPITLYNSSGQPTTSFHVTATDLNNNRLNFYFGTGSETKEITKVEIGLNKAANLNTGQNVTFFLDNVGLLNKPIGQTVSPFGKPSISNQPDFLKWLSYASYRFFDWNFVEVSVDGSLTPNAGSFLEESGEGDKVSISGQGMGLAMTVLALESGFISSSQAETRTLKSLTWINALNGSSNSLFDGTKGWHGMPSHYYNTAGELYDFDGPGGFDAPMVISTIDWAICAQGVRLARQYFDANSQIKSLADEILQRVDWSKFIMPTEDEFGKVLYEEDGVTPFKNGGRVAFDLIQDTGEINVSGNAWGQAFSEESDLVYLEVLSANKERQNLGIPFVDIDIDKVIYTDDQSNEVKVIHREWKNGFFPSYFGAGFTYNWLQLWTGSKKLNYDASGNYQGVSTSNTKYFDNSVSAYSADNITSMNQFLRPIMGLTAASTVSGIAPNGFITYGEYLGNQGSNQSLAQAKEVVQFAPAPYGAALALPFVQTEALEALQSYVDLGFYHEFMGLPDNVVFEGIGGLKPLPNWNQLDINMAPIAMAIDHIQLGVISDYLMKDEFTRDSYRKLYESFDTDFESNISVPPSALKGNEQLPSFLPEENEPYNQNVILFPNPNDGEFELTFSIPEAGNAFQGILLNSQGMLMEKYEWKFDKSGDYTVKVKLNDLPGISSGIYLLAIRSQNFRKVIPVLIEK